MDPDSQLGSDPQEDWHILLVDDEPASRAAISEWLERRGMRVISVSNGAEAEEHLNDGIAVIVTDLRMPRTDGMELLKIAKQKAPHAAVILISGFGTVDTAVMALKEGAFDFLSKPIKLPELSHRIDRALEQRRMAAEIANLHARLHQQAQVHNLVGSSAPMRELNEKISRVAQTKSTVLITGEPGTGKELVASAIHNSSDRCDHPFVPVNCAAIPESLVEAQLFGHEAGIYTGADKSREGFFYAANKGTLFLDEIGELPLASQSKLLRAIESRKIVPLGGTEEIPIDVRLIAATNRDLEAEIKEKKFREDLYYRLRVVQLQLPPLRERQDDIPLLTRFFLKQLCEEMDRPEISVTLEAAEAIRQYDWPGNVRDLRNTLEGILALSIKDTLELNDLPDYIRKSAPQADVIKVGMTMDEIEKQAILRTLEFNAGHRAKTAEMLGISERNLRRKLKQYDEEG